MLARDAAQDSACRVPGRLGDPGRGHAAELRRAGLPASRQIGFCGARRSSTKSGCAPESPSSFRQQQAPYGIRIHQAAGDWLKIPTAGMFQQHVGQEWVTGDPRVQVLGLEQRPDDLPTVDRFQPPQCQTHQNVVTDLRLVQRGHEHRGRRRVGSTLQGQPHLQRRVALVDRNLLVACSVDWLARPNVRARRSRTPWRSGPCCESPGSAPE